MEVKNVSVIGAGTMGSGIAQVIGVIMAIDSGVCDEKQLA